MDASREPPALEGTIELERRGPALTIRLRRPEVRNAFDDAMLRDLTRAAEWLHAEQTIRFVVLEGAGPVFCAGADFQWMQRMVEYTREENLEDARRLARCLELLDTLPQLTICKVRGAALGGGMGLVACADLVVAEPGARFGFPEVRLGLSPATIAPYVIRRLGPGRARTLFVTGRRFSAEQALAWGFVDQLAEPEALDAAVEELVRRSHAAAPGAVAACKELVRRVSGRPIPQVAEYTATLIAEMRVGPEGQEGLRAALGKRKPHWSEVPCSGES
jgi:methylglutaconyl-CoA hydratase